MEINRRTFLKGAALLGLLSCIPQGGAHATPTAGFVTSYRKGKTFFAAVLDQAGTLIHSLPLPARAHDAAIAPDGRTAVIIGRRPGWYALVMDLETGQELTRYSPPEDRHFYGHGCFSPDGRTLFITENDFEEERGTLGLYDVENNFTRIGEYDTHGVGPHEVLLMRDGETLAIANGGIATHPDFGRRKLNLPDMQPSLAYLNLKNGELLEQATLAAELHQLSLRHMCEDGTGQIWIGGQHQGSPDAEIPLVWTHRRGRDLIAAKAPAGTFSGFKHYIGSVTASADGQQVATSSPRGGAVLIWDSQSLHLVERFNAEDVCGLAAFQGQFLASDGKGNIWNKSHTPIQHTEMAWDNHIASL